MQWKSHAIIAFVSATAVFYFLTDVDLIRLIMLGIFAAMSALIPDMDLPQSKARSISDMIVVAVAAVFSYLSSCNWGFCIPGLNQIEKIVILALVVIGIYFLAMKFIMPRHRGFTHSLVSCLGFSVLVFLVAGMQFAIAGLVGYLSHLIADKEIKIL